jgi:hypothetical protein
MQYALVHIQSVQVHIQSARVQIQFAYVQVQSVWCRSEFAPVQPEYALNTGFMKSINYQLTIKLDLQIHITMAKQSFSPRSRIRLNSRLVQQLFAQKIGGYAMKYNLSAAEVAGRSSFISYISPTGLSIHDSLLKEYTLEGYGL